MAAQMEDGVFYDLNPPAVILGKNFHRVKCEYQVPNNPNEYSVSGVPEGAVEEESFILRFSEKGRVRAFRSENQEPRAKWLTTEHWSRLTKEKVKAELEHLLRNCKTKGEFEKECRHRFGAPLISLSWGETGRSIAICRRGKSESIYASVS